jgi:hypothetical protein
MEDKVVQETLVVQQLVERVVQEYSRLDIYYKQLMEIYLDNEIESQTEIKELMDELKETFGYIVSNVEFIPFIMER